MGAEDAHSVPLGSDVVASRAVADQASHSVAEREAEELVLLRGEVEHAIVAGADNEDADPELAQRSALYGDPIVAVVGHPDVTGLLPGVAPGRRRAVSVDPVAVEIEGDVVSADHDPVVRAVDEVAVEPRVGGDRVAALGLCVRSLGPVQRQEAEHGQGQCRRKKEEHGGGGVESKPDWHVVPLVWIASESALHANLLQVVR